MFTGIIESLGKSLSRTSGETGIELEIATPFRDLALGESVAVNGVCLTVAKVEPKSVIFRVSPETLARTGLGALKTDEQVNLERALLPTTRLSGHLVQGHVDGLAQISRIEKNGEYFELDFELPPQLSRYVVEKGSIALDGVSLTVNQIRENQIGIMLIPHTWSHTAFSSRRPGEFVNVEIDVMAKYLEKLCQPYLKQ